MDSLYNDVYCILGPEGSKCLKESIAVEVKTDCAISVQNLSMYIESFEEFEDDTGS